MIKCLSDTRSANLVSTFFRDFVSKIRLFESLFAAVTSERRNRESWQIWIKTRIQVR